MLHSTSNGQTALLPRHSPLGNSVSLRFDTSPGVSLRAAVDISGNCLSMRATTAWGNKRQRGLMLSHINNSRQH